MKIKLKVTMNLCEPAIIEAGLPEIIAFERQFDMPAAELGAVDRTQPTGEFDDDGNPTFKSIARFEWLAFMAHRAMLRQHLTTETDFDTWIADVVELGAEDTPAPVGKG